MSQRDNLRASREELALLGVTDEWMCAVDIALKLGTSWQSVAHALKRLVDQGKVERMVIKVPKPYRITEDHTLYRAVGVSRGMFPHWLEPRVPEMRIVKRTIFKSR
jgi:DNA-binding transcriptional ArsR family regulator